MTTRGKKGGAKGGDADQPIGDTDSSQDGAEAEAFEPGGGLEEAVTTPGTDVAEALAAVAAEAPEDTDPGLAIPEPIDPEATPPEGAPAGAHASQEEGEAGGEVLEFAQAEPRAAADDDLGEGEDEEVGRVPFEKLEALLESLLFAAERPLSVNDLKRMAGERDSRLVSQALEALSEKRKESGIQLIGVGGAYTLRTNPGFAPWVSRLVAGKPVRLSRALLETLAIVAYRQPITRPEIDDVRGVDCGPVLKTLLDRNLVRIIGKREEVGRPMLYGTTSEFLRIFNLKDLTQLPTLRQFHELSAEHQAKVDEEHPAPADAAAALVGGGATPIEPLVTSAVAPDPDEDDRLIADLEEASEAASRAAGPLLPETPPDPTRE